MVSPTSQKVRRRLNGKEEGASGKSAELLRDGRESSARIGALKDTMARLAAAALVAGVGLGAEAQFVPPPTVYVVYNAAIGLMYMGEGWDIGAYQWNPWGTNWLGICMLTPGTVPTYVAPKGMTAQQTLMAEEISTLSSYMTNSSPINSVNGSLPFSYRAGTNYAMEGFYDANKNLSGFYYNGNAGGVSINIALNTSYAGLGGSNYVRLETAAPANSNLISGWVGLSGTRLAINTPTEHVVEYVISPDGSKDIHISYNSLTALAATSMANQTNVYSELFNYVFTGLTNFAVDPVTSPYVSAVSLGQVYSNMASNQAAGESSVSSALLLQIEGSLGLRLPPPAPPSNLKPIRVTEGSQREMASSMPRYSFAEDPVILERRKIMLMSR